MKIPLKYADEIMKLTADGGNEVYLQICPFWDGEDEFFDIENISERELEQFKNLKHIYGESFIRPEIVSLLNKKGIEVK